MGRTLPSATQVLIHEEAALGKLRRALRRSEKLALDELFRYAHLHIAEAPQKYWGWQYASHTLPLEVFMLAMLLEEHKEVMRMKKLIEELLNIHHSDIPESGSEPASQDATPGFVDPGIGIDDNSTAPE